MRNDQVCEHWARQDRYEARSSNGNLYFEGGSLYSYGPHFCIARLLTAPSGDLVLLWNHTSYSVTTSGHQSRARWAWRRHGGTVAHEFTVQNPTGSAALNLDDYTRRIHECAERARRARKYTQFHIDRGRRLVAERAQFCRCFGYDCPDDVPVILETGGEDAEHFIYGGPLGEKPQEAGT